MIKLYAAAAALVVAMAAVNTTASVEASANAMTERHAQLLLIAGE